MSDEELKELLKNNNWKVTYSFPNGGFIVAERGLAIITFYNRKDKYRENHIIKTGIKKRLNA